ncbi:MAG: ANTAR domain-containing protein [Mycobacterium sp.]
MTNGRRHAAIPGDQQIVDLFSGPYRTRTGWPLAAPFRSPSNPLSVNDAGEAIGTEGFYVDVTRSPDEHQTTITEAAAEIAKHRSTIEQAKGVLMVVYGVDADAAF